MFRANIVDEKILKLFFPQETFNQTEIIVPLIEFQQEYVVHFLEKYNDLEKIYNIMCVYKHLNKISDSVLIKKFINYI